MSDVSTDRTDELLAPGEPVLSSWLLADARVLVTDRRLLVVAGEPDAESVRSLGHRHVAQCCVNRAGDVAELQI